MPPAIVDAAIRNRAALLAREQAAMQGAAVRWLQIERALSAQIDALAMELALNPERATMGKLARSRRYIQLQAQIDDELRRYAAYMESRIIDGQRAMATAAIEHSATMVNAVATEAQITVPFNRLPTAAVTDMIGTAGDGSPLRSTLDDASRGAGDALGQQLVNGVALGKGPVEVARQAIRLGLGQSFTRMQNISRTEQLRVYRLTTLASYENSRVVESYTRLSARDDRVCPACLFADGRTYPIDHGFDAHPSCRCTLVPRLRSAPAINFQNGQSWFEQQPEATQRTILGRGRFEAWQSGRASLDDMVRRIDDPTWGGSLVTTRVQDLG